MATSCLCFRDLELYFGSAAAAAAAAESLYQLRQGVEVEYGQSLAAVDISAAGMFECPHIDVGSIHVNC